MFGKGQSEADKQGLLMRCLIENVILKIGQQKLKFKPALDKTTKLQRFGSRRRLQSFLLEHCIRDSRIESRRTALLYT